MIIYYHLLSSIIIYYHLLSSIIIYYHLLSSIIIYYHLYLLSSYYYRAFLSQPFSITSHEFRALLQVVRQLRTAGVAWIHRDETWATRWLLALRGYDTSLYDLCKCIIPLKYHKTIEHGHLDGYWYCTG